MPQATTILTHFEEFVKARSVNQTSTSYVSKIPTNTEPNGDAGTATGASVLDIGHKGGIASNGVMIVPYGIGSNNNTFLMRVLHWKRIGRNPLTAIWVPITLLEATCTLSSTVLGVAGKEIIETEFFCDTIAIVGTSGGPNVSCELVSPADNTVGHIMLDLKSAQKLELTFSTGSSATSCNALIAKL